MEQFLSRQGSVSQIKQIQITSTKRIVQIKEEEEEEEELKNLCHRSFQIVLHYFINNLLKTWHKFKKNTLKITNLQLISFLPIYQHKTKVELYFRHSFLLTHDILEKLIPACRRPWRRNPTWVLSLLITTGCAILFTIMLFDFVITCILWSFCDYYSTIMSSSWFLWRVSMSCISLFTLTPITQFNWLRKFAVVVATIPIFKATKKKLKIKILAYDNMTGWYMHDYNDEVALVVGGYGHGMEIHISFPAQYTRRL